MPQEPGRVLLAEDDDTIRTLLRRFPESKGVAVIEADNGSKALAALDEQSIDLVVLDIGLPDLSGLDVLQGIRRQHPATALPVIMASAHGRSTDVVEALRLGANDYLVKPFNFAAALARVQTHLLLKRSVDRIVCLEQRLEQRNAELAEANRRMSDDLEAAAVVQRALLPREPLNVPGARFAWHFCPCDELAGDLLNVTVLDDRHVGLCVLDVVGHGVKAALMAVMISRVLGQFLSPRRRAKGRRRLSPARVAAELSRAFPWDERTEQFCTLLYGVLDLETGQFDFVSAGHPGPVWLSAAGRAERIEAAGPPIGLGSSEYSVHTITLQSGDRLYLYSNGLTEARDPEGQLFGEERLLSALEEGRSLSLQSSLAALTQSIERWGDRAAPSDDTSILAVEFVGPTVVQSGFGRVARLLQGQAAVS
jgi:sigma-B regulation protein RsbU (phosphoserine phosphatase)